MMKFWIKERNNPQLAQPYYTACGRMAIKVARRMESTIYGSNTMHSYDTREAYDKALQDLRASGARVLGEV